MKEINELLVEHPFTDGLEPEALVLIAGCAVNAVFHTDDYLLREGEDANVFYLIREGAVALELHVPGVGVRTFLTLKSGNMLGASWLVPPYRCSFDARALEPTHVFEFNAGCLRDKCDTYPELGYALMKRFVPPLIDRLQTARMQSLDIFGANAGGLLV